MLSKKRITKALNRLCGCAGWSAPVLFVNPRKTGFLASRPISCLSPTTLINSLGGILIRTPYLTLEKQFDPLCKIMFAGQCILLKCAKLLNHTIYFFYQILHSYTFSWIRTTVLQAVELHKRSPRPLSLEQLTYITLPMLVRLELHYPWVCTIITMWVLHDPWVCTTITMWVHPSVRPWSVSENAHHGSRTLLSVDLV